MTSCLVVQDPWILTYNGEGHSPEVELPTSDKPLLNTHP